MFVLYPNINIPIQSNHWTEKKLSTSYEDYSGKITQNNEVPGVGDYSIQVFFVPVCFFQVTILNIVCRCQRAYTPWCAHFPTDICSVIQEGVITVEKCAHCHLDKTDMDTTSQHLKKYISLGE